jgi:DNA-binding transcriptional MocR family regulator
LHGGCLKRTGLHLLRTLLFYFLNGHTGRCDPSLARLAKICGMARSTVVQALRRLEAAGIVTIVRRARCIWQQGRRRFVQWTNAYLLNIPSVFRKTAGDYSIPATPAKPCESANRRETTGAERKSLPPMPENVAAALARLGNAMAERLEAENRQAGPAMR